VKKEFWQDRWDTNQLGFHEGKPNELLVAHADRFAPKSRILVPLAGKAADMIWLAERGHDVVGVEFVKKAIDDLFAGSEVRTHALGPHQAFSARGITMVLGDMFEMKPDALGTFDAIYDRAALIALEPSTRARYLETCRALLKPNGTTLLIGFAYDQSKSPGPPFSIDERTVRDLFAGRTIQRLETRAANISPRMRDAGIASIEESAYLVR
jgi:thiopurine S-methyltransferase